MVLRDCAEPASAGEWIEAFGSTHPVLCDSEATAWDVYGVGLGKPQYIVIDQDMNIVFRGMGPGDASEAEAEVLELLD